MISIGRAARGAKKKRKKTGISVNRFADEKKIDFARHVRLLTITAAMTTTWVDILLTDKRLEAPQSALYHIRNTPSRILRFRCSIYESRAE